MHFSRTRVVAAVCATLTGAGTALAQVDLTVGGLFAGIEHDTDGYLEDLVGGGTLTSLFEYGWDDDGVPQIGSITSNLGYTISPTTVVVEMETAIVGGDPDQYVVGGPYFELTFDLFESTPFVLQHRLDDAGFVAIYPLYDWGWGEALHEQWGTTGTISGVLAPGTYGVYGYVVSDLAAARSASGEFTFSVPTPGLTLPAAGLLLAARRRRMG